MSARNKVRKPNPEPKTDLRPTPDGELEALRARINMKKEYIAVLELELFNTRAELDSFSLKYHARIAPLERRLKALQAFLKKTLGAERVRNGNGSRHARTNAWDSGEEDQPRQAGRPAAGEAAQPDPAKEEEIKALFRELAKRFHPDLVRDAKEKERREKIMAKVNQAFTDRDLEALRALAEEPDREANGKPRTRREEIAHLKAELEYLEGVIRELEHTLRELDRSPAMQLRMEVYLARQEGRDLLSDMAANLEERIDDIEAHLLALGVTPENLPTS